MRLTHDQLERDHCDLLWIINKLDPGSIHLDARCTKMPPPHVLTADCYPQPLTAAEQNAKNLNEYWARESGTQ